MFLCFFFLLTYAFQFKTIAIPYILKCKHSEFAWKVVHTSSIIHVYWRKSQSSMMINIRKTCPCNVYPLEPHFYTAKLGYAGVYIFFVFLFQNIVCGNTLETPRRVGSNVYPQSMF